MKTIEVYITRNYFKSISIEIEVPEGMTEDEEMKYLEDMEQKTSELSAAMEETSLTACDELEIIIEP